MIGIYVGLTIFLILLREHTLCYFVHYKSFYYGMHQNEEVLVLNETEIVPANRLVYTYDINAELARSDINFTFLEVHYYQPVSDVHIVFDHKTNMLTFYISLPIMVMPYKILGYSLNIVPATKLWPVKA